MIADRNEILAVFLVLQQFAQVAWTAVRSGEGPRGVGRRGICRDAPGYSWTGFSTFTTKSIPTWTWDNAIGREGDLWPLTHSLHFWYLRTSVSTLWQGTSFTILVMLSRGYAGASSGSPTVGPVLATWVIVPAGYGSHSWFCQMPSKPPVRNSIKCIEWWRSALEWVLRSNLVSAHCTHSANAISAVCISNGLVDCWLLRQQQPVNLRLENLKLLWSGSALATWAWLTPSMPCSWQCRLRSPR